MPIAVGSRLRTAGARNARGAGPKKGAEAKGALSIRRPTTLAGRV